MLHSSPIPLTLCWPGLARLGSARAVYLYLDRHSALCLLKLTCYAVSVEKTSISSCQFVCQLQLTVLHNVVVVLVVVVVVALVVSLSTHVLLLLLLCLAFANLPLLALHSNRYRYTYRYLDGHLNNARTASPTRLQRTFVMAWTYVLWVSCYWPLKK